MVTMVAGFMWCSLYILSRKKVLKQAFVTFHGDGQWYTKDDNFWKLIVGDFSTIHGVIYMMVAFLLLHFIRVKIRWYELVKTKIWMVKRKAEMVSLVVGGFLSGNTCESGVRAQVLVGVHSDHLQGERVDAQAQWSALEGTLGVRPANTFVAC